MSQKEEILNLLDGLKALIITCLTGLFGMLGYTVINYKELDLIQSVIIGIGCIVLISLISVSLKVYLKKLKILRDL